MIDGMFLAIAASALAVRVHSLVRFWQAPFSFGPDRFFGLPVAAEARQPLLRRYRRSLFAPVLLEASCLAADVAWGNAFHIFLEQVAALVVVRVFYSFVAVYFIRQGKWLAVEDSWTPVASVALSLKARRLADYTNTRLEIALVVGTATAVVLLAQHYLNRSASLAMAAGGWQARHNVREFELPVIFVYLQLGGLLAKHGLVKWRMWLPGERTEEYLRWREQVLRYLMWICDYFRGLLTASLLLDAAVVVSYATAAAPWVRYAGSFLLLATAIAGALPGVRLRRRMAALFAALQPLQDFSSPPQRLPPSGFHLGGLVYYDRENPSLFVPGPLVLALNLADRRACLYFAYLTGFPFLMLWIGAIRGS
jgi:hypothetical protein